MRTKLMVGLEMLVLRNPVNPVNAEQHQNLFQIVQLAQRDQGQIIYEILLSPSTSLGLKASKYTS